jgi:RimJ/RimL family protein N-acetyltransferase
MLSNKEPIERVELKGRRVLLEPLDPKHLSGMRSAIEDGDLWSIPVTAVPHPDDLPGFFELAETRYEAQLERQFATIDSETGTVVGSTRFMNINREHRRVEIGFTFIAKSWQRTHINTEAKYLMLRHAFEEWDCKRVELLTDALNYQSRRAIVRIGAKEEGILRNHMIMRDGRLRDSAIHSIVAAEWPGVKQSLERRFSNA